MPETQKPALFVFEDELIIQGLQARGYTQDQIGQFIYQARLTTQTLSYVVKVYEKAQKDLKDLLNPEPAGS